MSINLTRKEVLDLMSELNDNHWLQNRLLTELNNINQDNTRSVNSYVSDIDITVSTRSQQNIRGCHWEFYGNYCNRPTTGDSLFCEHHSNKRCFCGDLAGHGCPVELQFVCGSPLCGNHRTCKSH